MAMSPWIQLSEKKFADASKLALLIREDALAFCKSLYGGDATMGSPAAFSIRIDRIEE